MFCDKEYLLVIESGYFSVNIIELWSFGTLLGRYTFYTSNE